LSAEVRALERKRLGIIAGSGPEAGLQLWAAILETARERLGSLYHGDVDAPYVVIVSDPVLGHSMDLRSYEDFVLRHLEEAILTVDQTADVYAIACVTLHCFLPQIERIPNRVGTLVSAIDAIVAYAEKNSLKQIALISAETIPRERSLLLSRLKEFLTVELPNDPELVRELVLDIKRLGGVDGDVVLRFRNLVDSLTSETVMLACTDLPLVMTRIDGRNIIDCTRLLAESLVDRW
jgi:aspartate racemase